MDFNDPQRRSYVKHNAADFSSRYNPDVNNESPSPDYPDDTPQWYKLSSLNEMRQSYFSTNTTKQFLPRVCLPTITKTKDDEKSYDKFLDALSKSIDKQKNSTTDGKKTNILLSFLAVGVILVVVAIPLTTVLILQRDDGVTTEGSVTMKLTLDETFQNNMSIQGSEIFLATEQRICDQVQHAFTRDDSPMKNVYRLCTLSNLRNGSIVVRVVIKLSGIFTVPENSVFIKIITDSIGNSTTFGSYKIFTNSVTVETAVYTTGIDGTSRNTESPIVTTTTEPTSTSVETVTTTTEPTLTETVTSTTEPTSTSVETVTTTTEPTSTSVETVTTTTEPTSTSVETVITTTEPTSTETVTTTTEPTSTETVTTTTEPTSTSVDTVTTTTEPTSTSVETVTTTTEPTSTSVETVTTTTESTSTETVTTTTERTSTSVETVITTTEPTSTETVTTTTETVTTTTEPASTETVTTTTEPTSTSVDTVTTTTEPTSTAVETVTTTTEPTSTSVEAVTTKTEPTSTSVETVTTTTEPTSTSVETVTTTTEPTSTSVETVITTTESTSTETVTTTTEPTSTSVETVTTTTEPTSTSVETVITTTEPTSTSVETVTTPTTEAVTTITPTEIDTVMKCSSNNVTIDGNTTFKEGERYDITCTGNISTNAELHLYRLNTFMTEKFSNITFENNDNSNGSCYHSTTKIYSILADKSQNGTRLICIATEDNPPVNTSSEILTLRIVAADVRMAFHLQNTTWIPEYSDVNSQAFKSFAADIEQDMDLVYTNSEFSENYRGTSVVSLQPGSVIVTLVVDMTLIITTTDSAGNTLTVKISIHDIVNNIADTIQSLRDSGKLNSSLINTDTKDISGDITTEQDLPEDACSSQTDIVFLMDASGSITAPNFRTMKYFIQNFTAGLKIGTDALQLGIVKFSSNANTEFGLNQYHSPLTINNAVDTIIYTSGGTEIGKALTYVRTNSFLPGNGGRANATQVIILMTDGKSGDQPETVASTLKDEGVLIVCIGIGSGVNVNQLNSIAYNTSFVFDVNSFSVLIDVKNVVQESSCRDHL